MLPSNDLEDQVAKTYQLQSKSIQQIYNGVNKVFRISTNDKNLTLKIFNKNKTTKDNISFERKLTAHLSHRAFNCSEPILPPSENEQIYTFDQEHYYGILSQEVVGESYSGDNNQHDFMFGQAIRRLHSCQIPIFRKQNPGTNDMLNSSSDLEHSIRCPYKDELRATINRLSNHLKSHGAPPTTVTSYGICHGDAWPGNALYSEKSCSLIDFEHATISDQATDIATYIWWLTDCNQHEGQPLVSWNAFAKGYGDSIERLITPGTPTLIKINQLRCLVFMHRHIALNEQILEYVRRQTSDLMRRLEPTNSKEQLFDSLWGH